MCSKRCEVCAGGGGNQRLAMVGCWFGWTGMASAVTMMVTFSFWVVSVPKRYLRTGSLVSQGRPVVWVASTSLE